jgi:sialate O-acetylesterase
LVAAACWAAGAWAEVRLAPLFTDHAVLQHGRAVAVWGKADAGEAVTVKIAGQEVRTQADASGDWRVSLGALMPGGPFELVVSGPNNEERRADVMVGEVWLCSGQSNMDFTIARTEERYWCGVLNEEEVVAAARHPLIRQFKVPLAFSETPVDEVAGGEWVVCSPETAGEFSAVAYFFARNLQASLGQDMPVGLLVSSYGASTAHTWISRDGVAGHPQLAFLLEDYEKRKADFDQNRQRLEAEYAAALSAWEVAAKAAKDKGEREPRRPRAPQDPRRHQHNATLLYNGMISPLAPYAFRGVIWYQGESNGATHELYLSLMQTLVADWRKLWGEEFAFLGTQLASHRAPATQPVARSQKASVREAQRLTAKTVPNSAVAITIDIGDEKDVHPKNKQDVGRRLALLALADVYGQPGVVSRGPEHQSAEVLADGAVRVRFAHAAGGLEARAVNGAAAGELRGFSLLDESGKWAWAEAVIDGDSVVLRSGEVRRPVEVRYGWADFPIANLFNGAGLPAGPFRVELSK